MYIATGKDMVDGMVQGQLALYEQFLSALQGTVVSVKASGATITPQVLRQARNEFELRSGRTEEWMARERSDFYNQIMMLMEVEHDAATPYLNDWVVSVELMIGRALYLSKQSSKRTFLSGLRFGTAFRGLSYLMKSMHGSIGYLVQKEATKVHWNVRTADGKTMSVYRYLMPYFRLYASRVYTLASILSHKEHGEQLLEIHNKDGETLLSGKPEELLSKEIADQYFYFGSENYVAVST